MVPWQSTDLAPFGIDGRQIRVLLVDDDEAMVELSATFLERELEDLETTALTDPTAVLDELREREYDCLVSDYDMPALNGLELLEQLRDADVPIPFVLFTGKGSEEIASRAISAGIDEYLQKGGTEKYTVLANKVENLVSKHRAEKQVRQSFLAIESAQEGIGILDEDGIYRYVNEAYASVYNRERAELVGSHWDVLYPESEAKRFEQEILPELTRQGTWQGVSTGITKDGSAVREQLVLTQMEDGGHICIVRDLTAEEERTAEQLRQSRSSNAVAPGVSIIDPSQRNTPVIYVNEVFETLVGHTAADIVGKSWRTLYEGAECVERIATAIETAESVVAEPVIHMKSGEEHRTRLELTPVRGERGDVTHFVGVHREVTQQPADEHRND